MPIDTNSINLHTQPVSKPLFSNCLENIASKKALLDAGSVHAVAMNCLELLVHYLFYYLLYPFYPAYEQFYYERQVEAFASAGRQMPRYESSCFRDAILFLHRFIASPSTIGSIFPSSSYLVENITRKIPDLTATARPAQRYLEVGAGTGSFTEKIIAKLQPNDQLDIVEYDPTFCQLLRRKFHHLPNVTIYEKSILDHQSAPYDVVVAGVPLNSFKAAFVDQVFKKYVELTKPGGSLSYFEYIGLARIKQAFLGEEASSDFNKVLQLKADFFAQYGTECDSIYCNITPARVLHCVLPPAGAPALESAG